MKKTIIVILIVVACLIFFGVTSAGSKIVDQLEDALSKDNGITVIETVYPDEFTGTMLADYDTVELKFSQNCVNFNFEDVSISDYDFIVFDVVNSRLYPGDTNKVSYGLSFSDSGLTDSVANFCLVNSGGQFQWGDLFGEYGSVNHDFTFIIDSRSISEGSVSVYTYLNGAYVNKVVYSGVSSDVLEYFYINYDGTEEVYATYIVGGMYLYGFENASDCTIGDYISNTSLKLTDCPDSILSYVD